MPCFCKHVSLARLTPAAPLTVRAVPPQFLRMLSLLCLEPSAVRMDKQVLDVLPGSDPTWIQETLRAEAPGLEIPSVFPPGGGMMMIAMLRLSESGLLFPLQRPRDLVAEVQQAAASLEAHLAPQMQALGAFRSKGLENMAIAARLTLALRAKGVCPTTLTEVEVLDGYGESAARVQEILAIAADVAAAGVPPFRLTERQLSLAQRLAWLTTYREAATMSGLPPLSDPDFIDALKAQVALLAALPAPKLTIPPEQITAIADLDVVLEAFGPDALTPDGVARVNTLLGAVAKVEMALPPEAVALSAKLLETPDVTYVLQGMEVLQTSGAAVAASAAVTAPKTFGQIPILSQLEMMTTLSSVLDKVLGSPALGLCNDCVFPTDEIAARFAQVSLPEVPPALRA